MLPFKFIVYDDTQEFRFWNLWNFFSFDFKFIRPNQRWSRINSRKYHIVSFFHIQWKFINFKPFCYTI